MGQAAASLGREDDREVYGLVDQMEARVAAGLALASEDMALHKIVFSRVRKPILVKLLDVFWRLFVTMLQLALVVVGPSIATAKTTPNYWLRLDDPTDPTLSQLVEEYEGPPRRGGQGGGHSSQPIP